MKKLILSTGLLLITLSLYCVTIRKEAKVVNSNDTVLITYSSGIWTIESDTFFIGKFDTIYVNGNPYGDLTKLITDSSGYADTSGVAVTALNATNFDASSQEDNGILFEDTDTISSHRNLRWINNILYLSNSIGDSSRIAHANNDGLYIQTYDGSTRIGNIDMTNDAGGIRIEAGTVGNEQDITFYTYENGFIRFLTGEDNGDFRLTLEDSIYYLLSSSDSVLRVTPGQIKFFKDLILEQSVQSSSGNFKFYNNFNSVNFIAGDLTGNDTALLIKQDLFGDGSVLTNTYALKIYGINTAVGNSFTLWHNDEKRLYIHPDSTTLEYDAGDNYLNIGDEYVNVGVAGEGDKFKVTPDTTFFYNNLKVADDITYKIRHLFAYYTADYSPDVTQNVYLKINPGFTTAEATNVTFADDSATIQDAGDYIAEMSFTITGGNGDNFIIQIWLNGTSVKSARQSTNSDYNTVFTRWYFEDLVAGDDISFWITNTADNDDAILSNMDVYIYKIHTD